MAKSIKNSPKILGLDVSTKTIGWALFDMSSRDLLELTHISPRPKPVLDNKMEELFAKSTTFRKKLEEYKGLGIIKCINLLLSADVFAQLVVLCSCKKCT